MINQPRATLLPLPKNIQARLDVIVSAAQNFWEECPHYRHYTRQGTSHSWRVYQNLAELIKGFPTFIHLTDDEVLIASAAAWLYDIGMQCPNPKPLLGFGTDREAGLTQEQLELLRTKKHELSYQMISESISGIQPKLDLGLSKDDDYTELITEVCRWISDVPLEKVPETLPAYGIPVRTSLLVTLLRLADQLYIDRSRLDIDILQVCKLSAREKIRWWLYLYTKVLPIDKGQIRFFYSLPANLQEFFGKIRALLETEFDYARNPAVRYLWDKHGISIIPNDKPELNGQLLDITSQFDSELVKSLSHEVAPIETYHDRGFPKRKNNQKTGVRIFLSYASDDFVLVKEIYQRLLHENGFQPWMDTDLLPGEQKRISIQKAIRNSDFFMIFLSWRSVGKRGGLQREIRQALDIRQEMLDEDIYLIPVRLEECVIPENLGDIQPLDLFMPDGWSKLVKAIRVGMELRDSSEEIDKL